MRTRINTLLNQVEKIAKSANSANGKMSETQYMAKLVICAESNKSLFIQYAEKYIRKADEYEEEFGDDRLTFDNMLDVEDILLDFEATYKTSVDTLKHCRSITMRLLYTFDYEKAKEVTFVSHSKIDLIDELAEWRWKMYKKHDDFCEGVFTFDGEEDKYDFCQSGCAEHDCFDNGFSTNAQYLRWSRRSYEKKWQKMDYEALKAIL